MIANLMLIEDDSLDTMNVERELKKLKIDLPLYKARNGKEGLDILRADNYSKINPLPSVVIVDINMPRMNGLEFLAEVRQDPILRDLNVFFLTTSTEEVDREAAKKLGVSGFIEKPLTFEKFGDENGATIDTFSLFIDLLKLK